MVENDEKWYTQRGSRLDGPYSKATIHRYLMLGRIKNSDRVSKDGTIWEPITQVPELIPEELLDMNSDFGWRKYLRAREQVDERRPVIGSESEVVEERRAADISGESVLSKLRQDWTRAVNAQPIRGEKINYLPASLFGITLAVVLILILVNTTSFF